MSKKIYGVTVGTPLSPAKIAEKLKPVKTVNGIAPDENGNVNVQGGGSIAQETDPTVPAWAKQPSKPSYTAAEVGALPSSTVIPTVPTKVSAFENDKGYLTAHQDLSGYANKSDIPTALPNPHALTFTGAVSATYDGSKAVSIEIPSGGGSGGSGGLEILVDVTLTEAAKVIQVPIETEDMVTKLKAARAIRIYLLALQDAADTEATSKGTATIGIHSTWDAPFFSAKMVIPSPTTTWQTYGILNAEIIRCPWHSDNRELQNPVLITHGCNGETNYTETAVSSEFRIANVNVGQYFFVNGSQNMGSGSRFVVGVIA